MTTIRMTAWTMTAKNRYSEQSADLWHSHESAFLRFPNPSGRFVGKTGKTHKVYKMLAVPNSLVYNHE